MKKGITSTIKAAKRIVEQAPNGSLGHPRGGHQGAPGPPEPRADPPPPRHPGVRARPHRGQGHPAPPARLRGVQRRLRRRPDGRPRAALAGGAGRGAGPHDGVATTSSLRRSGKPIAVPSQDMVLGLDYLTKEKDGEKGEGMRLRRASTRSCSRTRAGKVDLHAGIKVRGVNGSLIDLESQVQRPGQRHRIRSPQWTRIDTTVGRVLFNEIVPAELRLHQQPLGKKELCSLVERCFKTLGHRPHRRAPRRSQALGFTFATVRRPLHLASRTCTSRIKKEEIVEARRKEVLRSRSRRRTASSPRASATTRSSTSGPHVTERISDVMFDEMKTSDARFKAASRDSTRST